ncbi:2-dehydro-3-deoxy-6-phosphogalactonate aldolase [Chelativorans sp.]|uniref:2-dehydro-3-deoxy-6-phosphogalactonate aldolase n=1 Tax=Chelativorans sp. TaxID=2203393 RepID=UPI002810F4CC|nr:2-dehydro-3-deoxy-6-phosphogalactonate aldolase [Chelativorans sp.]
MKRVKWPKLKRDLVAILRGLEPEEAPAVVETLLEAGFEAIEVPLNSPEPFRSIEIARRLAPAEILVGAGTVLTVEDVDRLQNAGGNLLVSPNVDPSVIARASDYGMVTMPGVFTPTEALAAARAGASALKFFPASVLGPGGIKAILAVLPVDLPVGAVGGVSESDFAAYKAIGVRTFGLGSSLYKSGASAKEVGEKAEAAISAYDAVFGR